MPPLYQDFWHVKSASNSGRKHLDNEKTHGLCVSLIVCTIFGQSDIFLALMIAQFFYVKRYAFFLHGVFVENCMARD